VLPQVLRRRTEVPLGERGEDSGLLPFGEQFVEVGGVAFCGLEPCLAREKGRGENSRRQADRFTEDRGDLGGRTGEAAGDVCVDPFALERLEQLARVFVDGR
jgi:hypothetical protein